MSNLYLTLTCVEKFNVPLVALQKALVPESLVEENNPDSNDLSNMAGMPSYFNFMFLFILNTKLAQRVIYSYMTVSLHVIQQLHSYFTHRQS